MDSPNPLQIAHGTLGGSYKNPITHRRESEKGNQAQVPHLRRNLMWNYRLCPLIWFRSPWVGSPMGPFDGILESSSLIGLESACWISAVYSPFCCNASYLARVFCLPHQNPAPSIAIARTPNWTPTPTPIAILLDDFVSLFFKDDIAVTVAVAVAFESKLTSVGLRVNSFSSVQHSFVLP